jgi:hypothetical protein
MKKQTLLPRLAAAVLLLSVTPALAQQPPPAPPVAPAAPAGDAAPVDEAKGHFQRGVQLFRESDFRAALVEFQRAFEMSKNYKVLFNIGQTQHELQDYAGALRSFQRYLEGGGAEIEAGRRAQVDDDLKKLQARVARLEIKSNAEGAEVLIDDVVVGKTPLKDPVLVSIGRRKVALQKGGQVSAARFVDLAGGDSIAVTVDLGDGGAARPPGPLAPPPQPLPPPPSRTGMWASLAVTGVLLAGTAVTGALALGAHSDAEKTLGTLGVKAADVEAAHSKVKTLALVTDIFGGAAIAMAGVTIILGVTGGKGEPEAPRAARLTLGPRGVMVGGSF